MEETVSIRGKFSRSPVSLSRNECNDHFTPNEARFPSANPSRRRSFEAEHRFNDSTALRRDALSLFSATIRFNLGITQLFVIMLWKNQTVFSRPSNLQKHPRDWIERRKSREIENLKNLECDGSYKTFDEMLRYSYYNLFTDTSDSLVKCLNLSAIKIKV